MSYEYDVFISYLRNEERLRWVRDVFLPLFTAYLSECMPEARRPKIFLDEKSIGGGTNWPLRLAQALSSSRILVGLWTPTYFSSDWCLTEFELMYNRARECGLCTARHPQELVVPATLQDGESFPEQAQEIQQLDIHDLATLWVADGSLTKENLSKKISQWIPEVAKAIRKAPKFDPKWLDGTAKKFTRTFKKQNRKQKDLPGR